MSLYVDGYPITVPAGIGINVPARTASSVRTHDNSGIITLTTDQANVGQFFTEWGHPISARCLGTVCSAVHIFVNGRAVPGDPGAVALHDHDDIVVSVGTAPVALPAPFDFARYGV